MLHIFQYFVDCRYREPDGVALFGSRGSWTESVKESSL